ncbi:TetR/AcrR family transcriptional regulator [Glutamicibacter sp. AOP33-2CA-4]|uniref:TetR/AcrR family transcriptional regulator n=1 Tax=Glutamicibacter sp. AOP33-2CA-4 TaxID=3457690 RepID=UPI004034E52F
MPRIVDHNQRRREIVEVTWRFIARQGFDKLNLRDLSAAAGYANGGLKTYFPNRDAILVATFNYVADSTSRRIAEKTATLKGVDAIRAFALEVLPLDEERRDEGRVAVHFWHLALGEPDLAEVNAVAMDRWRTMLDGWLVDILGDGHPGAMVARDSLLNFMLGAQGASVLDARTNTAQSLVEQLEYQLHALLALSR